MFFGIFMFVYLGGANINIPLNLKSEVIDLGHPPLDGTIRVSSEFGKRYYNKK